MTTTEETSFKSHCLERFQQTLDQFSRSLPSEKLGDAMRYSLFAGGKRIRPLLVYASGEISESPWNRRDTAALSVEIMHTYSLIHDDLPCMDNADLRRNLPSCHRKFNEHLAVLAGDALQMHAIELLSQPAFHSNPLHALRQIRILTEASGSHGMVLGQALDMSLEQAPDLAGIEKTHALKTGALFSACLQMGYLCTDQNTDERILETLSLAGTKMGIAFQIQDDILDVTATEAELGKSKCDEENGKCTSVTLLGLEGARKEYMRIYEELMHLLKPLPRSEELIKLLTQLHQRTG